MQYNLLSNTMICCTGNIIILHCNIFNILQRSQLQYLQLIFCNICRQTIKIGLMYPHIWHYIGPIYSQPCLYWVNFYSLSGSVAKPLPFCKISIAKIFNTMQNNIPCFAVVAMHHFSLLNLPTLCNIPHC